MPQCPNCQKHVGKKTRICSKCGTPLAPAPKPGTVTQATAAPPPPGILRKALPLLLLGVLLIGGGYLIVQSTLQARADARRTQFRNSLKLLGLVMHNFHDVYGHFPPFGESYRGASPAQSWMTYLLPSVGEAPLYNQLDLKKPWDETPVQAGFQQEVPAFLNLLLPPPSPDPRGYARSQLAGNSAIFQPEKGLSIRDISDGMSQTMLVGTVNEGFKPWADPSNVRDAGAGFGGGPNAFGAAGRGPVMVLMADGAVRNFSPSLDPAIARQIGDPQDGKPVKIEAIAVP